MNMLAQDKKQLSLLFAILVFSTLLLLSGCGGGQDESDDSQQVSQNESSSRESFDNEIADFRKAFPSSDTMNLSLKNATKKEKTYTASHKTDLQGEYRNSVSTSTSPPNNTPLLSMGQSLIHGVNDSVGMLFSIFKEIENSAPSNIKKEGETILATWGPFLDKSLPKLEILLSGSYDGGTIYKFILSVRPLDSVGAWTPLVSGESSLPNVFTPQRTGKFYFDISAAAELGVGAEGSGAVEIKFSVLSNEKEISVLFVNFRSSGSAEVIRGTLDFQQYENFSGHLTYKAIQNGWITPLPRPEPRQSMQLLQEKIELKMMWTKDSAGRALFNIAGGRFGEFYEGQTDECWEPTFQGVFYHQYFINIDGDLIENDPVNKQGNSDLCPLRATLPTL